MNGEIKVAERRAREIEILAANDFMSLRKIAQNLAVSDSTVRRDMETLERQGIIRRTHGGAILLRDGVNLSDPGQQASAEKAAIARTVARLLPPNGTLMINGGSTCVQIARALRGRRLSVVTNSVSVASLFASELAVEVTLIGGYVYPRIGVAVGDSAQRQVESLHATHFVTSCAAVTADGAFESNHMLVDIERQMMRSADEVILAVDHSKLALRSVVKLCELSDLDVIVTDDRADASVREWLGSLNTRVVYAPLG